MIPPKPPNRVVVCGGRKYADRECVFRVLDALHSAAPVDILVHGGCTGADRLAANWAIKNKVYALVYAADWDKHGRAAGPIRNQKMVDDNPGATLVAFPGGTGTEDMVRRARAGGLAVARCA